MQNKIFEQDFDPEKYMNDRLLEVTDDTERRQLRNLMDSFFTPFYQYMEEKYEILERRMLENSSQEKEFFDVVSTICPRDKLIAYEDTMFPIVEEDLEEQDLRVEDVIAHLEEKKECYCYSAYVQTDFEKLQNLWNEKRRFKGKIKTEDAEFEAYFILKRSKKYGEKIKQLYETFLRNQIPWRTLQVPYINKMIDVYIVDASYPEGDIIESMEVDFEEYREQIHFDMIPVWNVGKKIIRSSAYPAFEVDQINFTHIIYRSQLKETCQYLVANDQVEYWNVRKESGDLCIECKEVEPVSWQLLELHNNIKCYYKDAYPLMSNAREGQADNVLMRTLAGIQKRIGELKVDSYLKFREIQKIDGNNWKENNTYSMDEPIQEELQVQSNRPGLLLVFEAVDKSNYLNGDVLSYVVSCIQWELQEYRCFGKIL